MIFRLTSAAERQLAEIEIYSEAHFGRVKAEKYIADFFNRFKWLTEHSKLGQDRNDWAPGLRSFPQGSHLICYRQNRDAIDIVAVIHRSINAEDHVE